MPWSAHFSLFYETRADLLDTVVSYFKAGIEGDELCVWLPSEPSAETEAERDSANPCRISIAPRLPRRPGFRAYAGRWGLLGMRERADRIGATLSIRSTPRAGTTVNLRVPVAGTSRPGLRLTSQPIRIGVWVRRFTVVPARGCCGSTAWPDPVARSRIARSPQRRRTRERPGRRGSRGAIEIRHGFAESFLRFRFRGGLDAARHRAHRPRFPP